MPLSRKRKKEGKSRSRDRSEPQNAPAPPKETPTGGGGLLTRMRGGFQGMAGGGAGKKESLLSKIVTWAVVVLAAYFLARRFGILP